MNACPVPVLEARNYTPLALTASKSYLVTIFGISSLLSLPRESSGTHHLLADDKNNKVESVTRLLKPSWF